jgi:serpin B
MGFPKFTTESSFQLKETLTSIGMPDAFDNMKADFSGITGTRDLFLGDVIHKAYITVDEKGTEAAAATDPIYYLGISNEINEVTVDRPFIYFIRDDETNAILFMGRVTNPSV